MTLTKRQQTIGFYARTLARKNFKKVAEGNIEVCKAYLSGVPMPITPEIETKIKDDIKNRVVRLPYTFRKDFRSLLDKGFTHDEAIYRLIVDRMDVHYGNLIVKELKELEKSL